jgi:hypothetical protein
VLQTENASIGIVMESSRIRQLSLNGGNVLNLITLGAFRRAARRQRRELDGQERVRGLATTRSAAARRTRARPTSTASRCRIRPTATSSC